MRFPRTSRTYFYILYIFLTNLYNTIKTLWVLKNPLEPLEVLGSHQRINTSIQTDAYGRFYNRLFSPLNERDLTKEEKIL
jgi:hypothetical protein